MFLFKMVPFQRKIFIFRDLKYHISNFKFYLLLRVSREFPPPPLLRRSHWTLAELPPSPCLAGWTITALSIEYMLSMLIRMNIWDNFARLWNLHKPKLNRISITLLPITYHLNHSLPPDMRVEFQPSHTIQGVLYLYLCRYGCSCAWKRPRIKWFKHTTADIADTYFWSFTPQGLP